MTAGLGSLHVRTLSPAHLAEFIHKGRWKFYRHVKVIQQFIRRMLAGEFDRGIVLSPPQHGKSQYVSGGVLPYVMGHDPTIRAACISYSSRLAKKWGRAARDFFEEHGTELFGVTVNPQKRAADNWNFDGHPGGMISVGVGGSLVGEPVDFAVIDDYFKNSQAANSPTARDNLWDWYCTSFLTRLSKRAKVLIVCTTWHPDDLVGRLLEAQKSGGERWEVLHLPAIAPHEEEIPEDEHHLFFPDHLGRKPGEPLCPQLHSAEQLELVRATNPPHFWWALYMTRPTPGKGDLINEQMFRYYDPCEVPTARDPRTGSYYYPKPGWKFDDVIQSWDCKSSKKNTRAGAYVCGEVWGRKGTDMFLLDLVRGRWGIEETIAQIRLISERWPMANVKLVENKAAGPEIVRRLRNEISGFRDWPVEGDKETRMRAQEHHFVGGHVWLPSPGTAAWMRAFRAELCQFPKGFSDQVDSCSQALDYLGRRIKLNAKPLTEQRKSVFLLRKN